MRIFFAGAENTQSARALQSLKVPYVLMSYYYLRSKDKADLINFVKTYRNNGAKMILLDSGAHTFFTEHGIGDLGKRKQAVRKTKMSESPETYFIRYFGWLKVFSSLFDYCVELDIDRVPGIGLEKVKEWRKQLVDNKINVLPVYHSSMSLDELEDLCQNFDYVAVEGDRTIGEYSSYFNIAKKYKTRLHGFAMTKMDLISKIPFYSGDSTSWKAGSQYGVTYIFKGNKLQGYGKDDKSQRRRIRNDLEAIGINWAKLERDDVDEVDKMNIWSWLKLGEHLEAHQNKYWEDNAESFNKNNPEFNKNKGKIQEITKDPEIEKKRRENALIALKGNLFAFKDGKTASNLPLYCNNCYVKDKCPLYQAPEKESQLVYCSMAGIFDKMIRPENFDIRDKATVDEASNTLMKLQMRRAGMNLYFEMLDGGIQDKSLTGLLTWLYERLKGIPKIEVSFTNVYQIANEIKNKCIDDNVKQQILGVLDGDYSEVDAESEGRD